MKHDSGLSVVGRILLNVWRLLRHEVKLNIYTFQNVCWHVLRHRFPEVSHQTLTTWYRSGAVGMWRALKYHIDRCHWTLILLDKLDLGNAKKSASSAFAHDVFIVVFLSCSGSNE
jgi:DNA polymerase zeta